MTSQNAWDHITVGNHLINLWIPRSQSLSRFCQHCSSLYVATGLGSAWCFSWKSRSITTFAVCVLAFDSLLLLHAIGRAFLQDPGTSAALLPAVTPAVQTVIELCKTQLFRQQPTQRPPLTVYRGGLLYRAAAVNTHFCGRLQVSMQFCSRMEKQDLSARVRS